MTVWCSCVECVGDQYEPTDEEIAAWKHPPCQECGAVTKEEAKTKCLCSGNKVNCHGRQLWPG